MKDGEYMLTRMEDASIGSQWELLMKPLSIIPNLSFYLGMIQMVETQLLLKVRESRT